MEDNNSNIIFSIKSDSKNKNNILNKNVIDIILITIMSFLPIKKIYLNKIVCKNWKNILISELSKNIITFKIPIKIQYLRKISLDFFADNIFNINNQVFFSGYNFCCHLSLYNYTKNKYVNMNLIASNSKYICVKYYNIKILNLQFEELFSWNNYCGYNDIAIGENFVFIVKLNSCYIFDFEGNHINTWNISSNDKILAMRININREYIYITVNDYHTNWLQIFSQKGKLIKKIKISENFDDKKRNIHFTISTDIIYIYDFVDDTINTFTCNGQSISKYPLSNSFYNKTHKNLSDILVIDDLLYLCYSTNYFIIFKLKYC